MATTRRQFFQNPLGRLLASITRRTEGPQFGLATYWQEIPALIHYCRETGVEGVVLEIEHAQKIAVSPSIEDRAAVRKEFANSDVELVGLGTKWALYHQEATQFAHAINQAKASIILAHDVGAGGIKVDLEHPRGGEFSGQTVSQIGRALHTLGKFAEDYGQEVRLEICGQTPDYMQIVNAANHRNVRACWNCNAADLKKQDFASYFEMTRESLAETLHIHELSGNVAVYRNLFALLGASEYVGWILLEIQTAYPVAALRRQRTLFDMLIKP